MYTIHLDNHLCNENFHWTFRECWLTLKAIIQHIPANCRKSLTYGLSAAFKIKTKKSSIDFIQFPLGFPQKLMFSNIKGRKKQRSLTRYFLSLHQTLKKKAASKTFKTAFYDRNQATFFPEPCPFPFWFYCQEHPSFCLIRH